MAEAHRWIAVVDDDPSVLKALSRLLRTRAITARTFESANAFIASLAGGLPQCLIVDLQMPGTSGLELQHYLIRNGVRIPTIVITAHADAGMRERCKAAGAVAFLPKPLQDTTLFAAIDRATGPE
jgi:FixJ family two-component response regulator